MPKEHTVKTWDNLSKLLEKSRERGWIFRGEVRCDYGSLRPKVGRPSLDRSGNIRRIYSLESEIRIFNEFKRAARPYLEYEPKSDIEWLALGQHHGLPTRLLDWSDSLLVAAFFAVEKAGTVSGQRCDAVIYGVQGIRELSATDNIFRLDSVAAYHPAHISPRIPSQRSVFTVHPDPTEDYAENIGFKCTILADACWQIKRTLNASAINHGSLFPGIDGLCRQLDWSYKWDFFERKNPLPEISTD
jgi:hypothetical protein